MSENGNATRARSLDRLIDLLLASISGAVALAVQVVCTRLAIQVFGTGTTTISAMIASALLGLAAGSTIVGRLTDKWQRPIIGLGIMFASAAAISCVIALYGRSIALLVDGLFATTSHENGIGRRLAFALVSLFPINFVLGGTIPILVRNLGSTAGSVKHSTAIFGPLYAAETAGAAIGSLVVGIWSIQTIGLSWTMLVAGMLCFLATGLCWLRRGQDHSFVTFEATTTSQKLVGWKPFWFLLIVSMAGCASIAMEVIWQRFFVVILGSDTHSFAITATAFLIGIGLGAMASVRICSWSTNPTRLYGIILLATACSVLASTLIVLWWIEDEKAAVWWTQLIISYPVAARFLLTLATMIVPTTFIGLGLPIASAAWAQDPKAVGREIGELYGAALFGNVIGVFAAGYWLVLQYGLRTSTILLSSLCLIGGLMMILSGDRNKSPESSEVTYRSRKSSLLSIVLCISWIALALQVHDRHAFLGYYSDRSKWSVDYYRETAANTVAVVHAKENKNVRKMLIDGVSIGESGGGVDEKQQLLAHLPFLVKPSKPNQQALTIGLGTGILAGELLKNEQIFSVCCVEISEAVIEAAELFEDLNGGLKQNARFELVRADGVRFLQESDQHFDVIVSDAKSRPGHAGNVNFFSKEYYELCSSRLSDDGVFIQWIATNTAPSATDIILHTFFDSFPFGHVAIATPNSIFVVGSKQPLSLHQPHVDSYLSQSSSRSIREYNWRTFHDVVSMYWLDQSSVRQSRLSDVPINSFDRPALESTALESFHFDPKLQGNRQLRNLLALLQFDLAGDIENSSFNSKQLIDLENEHLRKSLLKGRLGCLEILNGAIAYSERKENWLDSAAEHYVQAISFLPKLSRQYELIESYRQIANEASGNNVNREFSALVQISKLNGSTANDEFRMGQILTELGQYEKALPFYFEATKKAPENPDWQAEFGFALLRFKRPSQAKTRFENVLRQNPEHNLSRLGLGISLKASGNEQEGTALIGAAIAAQSDLKSRLQEFEGHGEIDK